MSSMSRRWPFWIALEFGMLTQSGTAAAAPPATIKIPYSTPVKLVLLEKLSSATSKVEQAVHLEVTEDVTVHGVVIIRRGAAAGAHVVSVARRGKMGRPGKLDIELDWVEAVDGLSKSIRADPPSPHGTRKSPVILSGAKNLAPFRLIEHGKDVEIPQGSRFVAYIGANEEISLDNVAGSPSIPAAAPPQPSAPAVVQLSVVTFTSTPDHADITVDGKFVGTTPSSIRLPPGDHSVTMEMAGYKLWQRTVTIFAGGEVSLNATLEKVP